MSDYFTRWTLEANSGTPVTPAEDEDALGEGAVSVMPDLVCLSNFQARVPQFGIVALVRIAQREHTTISHVLAGQLLDLAAAEADTLEICIRTRRRHPLAAGVGVARIMTTPAINLPLGTVLTHKGVNTPYRSIECRAMACTQGIKEGTRLIASTDENRLVLSGIRLPVRAMEGRRRTILTDHEAE